MAQNYFANIDSITKELKFKWKSKDRNQSNKHFSSVEQKVYRRKNCVYFSCRNFNLWFEIQRPEEYRTLIE